MIGVKTGHWAWTDAQTPPPNAVWIFTGSVVASAPPAPALPRVTGTMIEA